MKREQAYKILGLDIGASDKDIEEKYQEMIKKNHPDQGGSAEIFKQIKEAYDTLNSADSEDQTSQNQSSHRAAKARSTENNKAKSQHYDLSMMSNIEVSKLVDNSLGLLVTEDRLVRTKSLQAMDQALTDSPLIEYLYQGEQPLFAFRFSKITMFGDTRSPANKGFLVLSDRRLLIIVGFEDGDETHTVPWSTIQDVNLRNGFVSYKFIIDTPETEIRIKLSHTEGSAGAISGQQELEREYQRAEQFIREAVYTTLD